MKPTSNHALKLPGSDCGTPKTHKGFIAYFLHACLLLGAALAFLVVLVVNAFADHTPAPYGYERGQAGKDYCRNLGIWYGSVQHFIAKGANRVQIQLAITPHLQYEVDHDWMTKDDMWKLLGYAASAPKGHSEIVIAETAQLYCESEREDAKPEPIAWPKPENADFPDDVLCVYWVNFAKSISHHAPNFSSADEMINHWNLQISTIDIDLSESFIATAHKLIRWVYKTRPVMDQNGEQRVFDLCLSGAPL